MAQLEFLKSIPDAAIHQKSDGAYKTISEVSDELDVPQHVLRFWESHFTQIKPTRMRGRRYYRPEDIDFLKAIKALLYAQGYTIKGAKKLVKSKDFDPARLTLIPHVSSQPAALLPVTSKSDEPKPDIKALANELRILKTMLTTLL